LKLLKFLIPIVFCHFILPFVSFLAVAQPTLLINDIKWPPYFFPEESNSNEIGFAKAILNKCLTEQNLSFTYILLPIKRTHKFIESGKIDVSIYSYKPERTNSVLYNKVPLFVSEYGFASRTEDDINIKRLEDIKPYKFGHLSGLTYTPELQKILNDKKALNELTIGHTLDAMFKLLLANTPRFQIMSNSKETLKWQAQKLNASDKIQVHDYVLKKKPYYVTVSKQSKNIENPEKFLKEMDNCISRFKSSSKYQSLLSDYGL